MSDTVQRIASLVASFDKNEGSIGSLSTGESIAVALVLDRKDLLDGYNMLEAVERLGPEWTRAALMVQRARR